MVNTKNKLLKTGLNLNGLAFFCVVAIITNPSTFSGGKNTIFYNIMGGLFFKKQKTVTVP